MTYPKVTEIRTEWTPEQVAANESARKAHEVQQQRIDEWRRAEIERDGWKAQSIRYPDHPTVCPKR